VVVSADECPYYRRPSVAAALAPIGSTLPVARLGQGANTRRRIACCLNAQSGHLHCWQRYQFDRHTLRRF
jgi:hypothetical protein